MRLAVALLAPAILVGACSMAGDADPDDASPDLVVHGGPVLTMDDASTVSDAIAVADGKVVAVGTADEVLALADQDTRIVHLGGRTVMPGVVEPHTHLLQGVAPDRAAMLEGQAELLAGGITTAGMPTVLPDQLPAFEALAADGELVVRTVLYLSWNDNCGDLLGDWAFDHEFGLDLDEPLSIGGVKVFADGGSCHAPAVSFEYLEGKPNQWRDLGWQGHGDLFVTADEVASVVRRADDAGGAVVVHAIGDVAIDTALDGYQRAGSLTQPHRIDHNSFASLLPGKSRSRYAQLGIRVAMQLMPWSNGCDQEVADAWNAMIPADALARVEEWSSLLEANPSLVAAWHGDGPWIPGNPFQQAYAMITGGYADPDGSVCHPEEWASRQTMSAEETLRLLTSSAAEAMGASHTVGSLEPGKAADLLVLQSDPLAADPEVGLAMNRPLATVIAGDMVHCVDDGCDLFDEDAPTDGDD